MAAILQLLCKVSSFGFRVENPTLVSLLIVQGGQEGND